MPKVIRIFLIALLVTQLSAFLVKADQYTPIVFQKAGPVNEALVFVGTPNDKIGKTAKVVKGTLVTGDAMTFAQELLSLRRSRDEVKFKSMLSGKTESNLERSKSAQANLEEVKEGKFLYGDRDVKFFVTSNRVEAPEFKGLNNKYRHYLEAPEISLVFYHYDPVKNFLIGSKFYLVNTPLGYRIVFPIEN